MKRLTFILGPLAAYFAAWSGMFVLVGHKRPDTTGLPPILGIEACPLAAFLLLSRRCNPAVA